MRKPVLVAFLLSITVFMVACGQKPGVHIAAVGSGGGGGGADSSGSGEGGGVGGSSGGGGSSASGNGTGIGGGGSSSSGTGGSGGTTSRTGSEGSGGTSGGGTTGGKTTSSTSGNTTGITPTSITVGIHAPITGAAPIEAKAFNVGKDIYWNYLAKAKKESIYGRTVKVVFRDDQYNPTTAVAVCDQMASSDRAFLLAGAAGTDQINACSKYANDRGIPYLSAGVQTAGVNTRATYFALSMTYAAQMPLLAQYICKLGAGANKYGGSTSPVTVAMIRPNTPNFNDAQTALQNAIAGLAGKCGATYAFKYHTVVKEGSTSEASSVALALQQENADIVSPVTAPLFTIQLAINTGGQQYFPRYMGVGITNGINQGIARECDGNDTSRPFQDAMFFSPWPGWRNVMGLEPGERYDSEYADAIAYTPGASDINTVGNGGDLMLALWGIMKDLHQVFKAAGQNLTRQSFIQTMNTFQTKTGVFPDLAFAPNNHFGARSVHALRGKCNYGPPGNKPEVHQFIEDPIFPGLRTSF